MMGWPGPMTHRQFLAWRGWLDDQWNRPDRTDHYIMQLTLEVLKLPRLLWGEKPPDVKMEHVRIEFRDKNDSKGPTLTPLQKMKIHMAGVLAAVGYTGPLPEHLKSSPRPESSGTSESSEDGR